MIPVPAIRARKALALLFLGAAVVGIGACESERPTAQGPVDLDTYATVMGELADLKRFPPSAPDSARRAARADSIRQAIVDRHGVTADELLEFAETVGERPRRMLEVSDRIVAISDSLARLRAGGENPGGYDARDATALPGDTAVDGDSVALDREAPRRAVTDSPARTRPLSDLRELRERRDRVRARTDTLRAPPSP